jgi:hypothetical protein
MISILDLSLGNEKGLELEAKTRHIRAIGGLARSRLRRLWPEEAAHQSLAYSDQTLK